MAPGYRVNLPTLALKTMEIPVAVLPAMMVRRVVVAIVTIPSIIVAPMPEIVLCSVSQMVPAMMPMMFVVSVVFACTTDATFVAMLSAMAMVASVGVGDRLSNLKGIAEILMSGMRRQCKNPDKGGNDADFDQDISHDLLDNSERGATIGLYH